MSGWNGRRVTEARANLAARTTWPTPCGQCGKPVDRVPDRGWALGHIEPRWARPDLIWEPSNHRVEHRACSDASGQAQALARAHAAGAKSVYNDGVFPHPGDPRQPPLLPAHTHGTSVDPVEARDGLSWASLCHEAPQWLTPYLDVPGDAAPPLWVSGVHPDAVGSYGPAAIEWMEANIVERGRPLRLRWWQRLAVVLQMQHREDGSLCWRVVLESGPRRIGKSVRLRAMALWRLANGPDLFEPEQLVLHTGKDLAIVREVMRKAWAWAGPRVDWDIKRGMTEPEVSYRSANRWVARSKDSTTGYDACLVLCDEAWDVPPSSIDDDVEPTMLERVSPQMLLTSTAHRRATSLMRGRISSALADDDGETMLLVWAMPPGSDPGSEEAWRAASPHWSPERRAMIANRYGLALAGQADPEADDADPMQGFLAQYGNVWRLRERKAQRGDAAVEPTTWEALAVDPPFVRPDAVAIEGWPSEGLSVACAWRQGAQSVVAVSDHADLASAAKAVRESGFKGYVHVGVSLMKDPALAKMRKREGKGRVGATVAEMVRLIGEDVVRHDGGEHLSGQVLAQRTLPGADGPRVVSTGRSDAVKAAVWAIAASRSARSGKPLVVFRQAEPTGA